MGFISFVMSEGIIDLHHILFYLYKYHKQTCCHGSAWAYGMTADNHVSQGSPLIGAARQRFLLVWAALWLSQLGRRFQTEQTCFVMLRDIENSLCVTGQQMLRVSTDSGLQGHNSNVSVLTPPS